MRGEAREVLKAALAEYAREEEIKPVLVWLASHQLKWNTLQSRAGMSPSRLKETLADVEAHVRRRLEEYVAEGAMPPR
jgi:AraC-like DNA-binding protein